jgi:outer membrane protein
MKRFTAITLLVFCVAFTGKSQNLKFGHINSDELIQSMPEWDSANANLEKFRKDLVNNIDIMSVELNNKNDAYNKEQKNWTDIVKQTKEQEIIDLQRRIQDFQQNAQVQFQNKQVELFQPVTTKVEKAIKDVGKENGFLYVFDVSKGVLLYFDEAKSTDIMPLAKAKLGLK